LPAWIVPVLPLDELPNFGLHRALLATDLGEEPGGAPELAHRFVLFSGAMKKVREVVVESRLAVTVAEPGRASEGFARQLDRSLMVAGATKREGQVVQGGDARGVVSDTRPGRKALFEPRVL
jgi:hypothetical protein